MVNIKLLALALVVLTQCGWSWGWQEAITPTSIVYPGAVATTNTTLSSAQTGNTIIFNNATLVAANGTQFTLPAATLGLQFTIVADTNKWFYIKPASTSDTINIGSAAAGQRVSNRATAAIGDSITIICITNGQWSVADRMGTWAAEP